MSTHVARTLFVSILLAVPAPLFAQGETSFESLAIPPQGVGTCVAAAEASTPRTGPLRGQQLVIRGGNPLREREISLFLNDGGRPVRLSELRMVSTGAQNAEAFGVVALLDTAGNVRGVRTQHTIQMADGGFDRIDRAAMRSMRESATTRASNRPLDAAAQQQVRDLVVWMRKRCGL